MPQLRRYSPTKLWDGAQMAIFCIIFASCIFSEPRAAHFRPTFQIRTKATPCVEVWQTSNLRPLRLGEEKVRKKKKETGWKYIWSALLHRATIKKEQPCPSVDQFAKFIGRHGSRAASLSDNSLDVDHLIYLRQYMIDVWARWQQSDKDINQCCDDRVLTVEPEQGIFEHWLWLVNYFVKIYAWSCH